MKTTEQIRLDEAREQKIPWKKWGPYLSERQWGTVREDYRENGDAWNFFTHDQARSRAYRWGEDAFMDGMCLMNRLPTAVMVKQKIFGNPVGIRLSVPMF